MHFERVDHACRFDTASKRGEAPRIAPGTDVRTFRCADYLGWENESLPFAPSGNVKRVREG